VPCHPDSPGKCGPRRHRESGLAHHDFRIVDLQADPPTVYHHHHHEVSCNGRMRYRIEQGAEMHDRDDPPMDVGHATYRRLTGRHRMDSGDLGYLYNLGELESYPAVTSSHEKKPTFGACHRLIIRVSSAVILPAISATGRT
jgi:hypothetical protein